MPDLPEQQSIEEQKRQEAARQSAEEARRKADELVRQQGEQIQKETGAQTGTEWQWKRYIAPDQQQARKDIVLTRLINSGAPDDVVAEYMRRNPESYQVSGMERITKPVIERVEAVEKQKIEQAQERFKSENVNVQGTWINRQELDALRRNEPYLWTVLNTDGYQAYLKANRERKEKLGEIESRVMAKFETELKEQQKKESDSNTLTNEQLYLIEKEVQKQQEKQYLDLSTDINKLKDYKSGDGYDIARYLRNNPGDTETLLNAGFKESDIKEASKFNREVFGVGIESYVGKRDFVIQYFKDKGWEYNKERLDISNPVELREELERLYPNAKDLKYITPYSMAVAIYNAQIKEAENAYQERHPAPKMDVYQYVEEYFKDRGWDYRYKDIKKDTDAITIIPIGPAANKLYLERVKEARNSYTDKYGKGAFVSSVAGEQAAYIFAPARAIKPNVEIKDITGMEWGIGAAQVALLTLPITSAVLKPLGGVAQRVGSTIITTGSAGLFTYDTINQWDNMSTTDKVLASIIDTVLIVSSISTTAGLAKSRGFDITSEKGAVFEITGNRKIASILDDMNNAIKNGDTVKLIESAKKLEIEAGTIPKELGGDYLRNKARLIEANADDWIRVAKEEPSGQVSKNLKDGIEANKQHLDLLRQQIKKTKNPDRIKAIDDAIKNTEKAVEEKQKRVTTQTKLKDLQVKVKEAKTEQPPAIKTSTALTKLKESKQTARVRGNAIPVRELFTKSLRQTRREYNVSNKDLIDAYLGLPINTRKIVIIANPEIARIIETIQKRKIKQVPDTELETETQPSPYPMRKRKLATDTEIQTEVKTETKTEPYPARKTKTLTDTSVLPQTKPQPMPYPQPEEQFKSPTQQLTEKEKGKKRIPPKTSEFDKKEWTPAEIESAIAWKDGFVIHAIRSPYRRGVDERTYHVDNAPSGLKLITTYQGPGSQQRSARTLGKSIPQRITVDVGNQDVIISKTKGQGIRLKHKLDKGTVTRSQLTVRKNRNLSKKRGRIYHTRDGSSTIISRRALKSVRSIF